MSELELKYAPRKCKHFCCGDCTIDMKSCGHDIDENAVCFEKLQQNTEEFKNYFKQITFIIQKDGYPREKLYLDKTISNYYKALKTLDRIKEYALNCMRDYHQGLCASQELLDILEESKNEK